MQRLISLFGFLIQMRIPRLNNFKKEFKLKRVFTVEAPGGLDISHIPSSSPS